VKVGLGERQGLSGSSEAARLSWVWPHAKPLTYPGRESNKG
jgi:hypothetical protein